MKLIEFVNAKWCEGQRSWSYGIVSGEVAACEVASGFPAHLMSEKLLMANSLMQGQIKIKGSDLAGFSDEERHILFSQIGWLLQEPLLISTLSLEDNLWLPLLAHARLDSSHWKSRVEEMIQKIHLTSSLSVRPHLATGRDRMMISVLRAFVHEPAVIFSFVDFYSLENRDVEILLDMLMNFSKLKNKSVIIFQYGERVHHALVNIQRGPGIVCS